MAEVKVKGPRTGFWEYCILGFFIFLRSCCLRDPRLQRRVAWRLLCWLHWSSCMALRVQESRKTFSSPCLMVCDNWHTSVWWPGRFPLLCHQGHKLMRPRIMIKYAEWSEVWRTENMVAGMWRPCFASLKTNNELSHSATYSGKEDVVCPHVVLVAPVHRLCRYASASQGVRGAHGVAAC